MLLFILCGVMRYLFYYKNTVKMNSAFCMCNLILCIYVITVLSDRVLVWDEGHGRNLFYVLALLFSLS